MNLFLNLKSNRLDEKLVTHLNRNIVIARFDLGNFYDNFFRALFHYSGSVVILVV